MVRIKHLGTESIDLELCDVNFGPAKNQSDGPNFPKQWSRGTDFLRLMMIAGSFQH